MSVDQHPPKKVPAALREAQLLGYDQYIDKQIHSTRRLVKLVDMATVLAVLATGALAFLLAAAVVEHWLWPGGFGGFSRAVLFVALVGGGGYYAVRRLWPLVVRSINPVYAAQTIERSSPTLKNSLLNLLLFRERREDVTDAVYETLEEQAAQRLVRVPIDSAVDRSHLIRLGYVLVAVVTICALYKIFSPKDPLITAERVLAPWADIVPPSRVAITAVEPGTTTLARGEMLEVSAEVHGIGEDDPVVIRYTTEDHQAVDQAVAMSPSAAGLRFTGKLPAPQSGAPLGVAQDLRYRIEAGDARSKEYKITVVAAPTITVESVDYDYPEYTGFADRSVEALGDIRAIEGTRVTIHARANEPIEEASVDFEADGHSDVKMNVEGEEARTAFLLTLREDRQTPRYKSYVLRFTGDDGRRNHDPVKFAIDTLPDYGPEVTVLAPQEKARDVRLDETIAIEVEARDPDFALANVRVHGDVAGHTAFDAPLLEKSHTGKFTGRFLLTPSKQNLKPGDLVRYWAVARDNRAPDANEAVTEPRLLRIASADPNQQQRQPPPDRVAQRDRERPPRPDDKNQPQPNRPQDGQKQPGDSSAGHESGGQKNNQQGQDGKPQPAGESASSDGKKTQPDQNSQGSGESSPGESSKDNEQNKDNNQQQPGGSASKSDGQQSKDNATKQPQSQGDEPGGQPSGSDQSSAQGKGGKPSQSQSGQKQSSDQPQDGNSPSQGQPKTGQGAKPNGQSQSKPDPSASPVSSEGDNDGEAFDRIQQFLKRKGDLPKEGQSKGEQEKQSSAKDQQGDQKGEQQGDSNSQNGQNQNGQPSNGAQQDQANEQQNGNNSDSKGQGQQSKSHQQTGDKQQGAQDSRQSEKNADKSDQPAEQGKQSEQSDSTGQNKAQGDPSSQQRRDGQQAGKNEDRNQDGGAKSKPGESGQKQDGTSGQSGDQSKSRSDKQGDSKSPNDHETSSQGPAGGGQQSQKDQPSPEASPRNTPGEKPQQQPSDNKSSENSEPPSGGHGKKQNDSQGEQGGDHTGGGKQGGGQKSPHDGTGSTGQNQSADNGDGESSEKGQGQNSPSAGDSAPSKDRTGQSGSKEPGQGSTERKGEGQQPGGKESTNHDATQNANNDSKSSDSNQQPGGESASADGKPGASENNKNNSKQPPGDNSQNPNSTSDGTPDGSGTNVPTGAGEPNRSAGPMPEGDSANLEYARKQTDLVVETLSEQLKRRQIDKRLLDELGWNEQDLKRFVDRWQQLQAAARGNGPDAKTAQRELDDALRSLGLRPGTLQQSKASRDQVRDLREGYRGPVPAEYQERLRAYNQGVSRAKQDAE